MENNERIGELLVSSGAFTDLKHPVILASGELGIYYVNTEKLLGDDGAWENFAKSPETIDSMGMINHAVKMRKENPDFAEVIKIMAEHISPLFIGDYKSISGGERRDWLFSGPVARELKVPHITFYKDGRMDVLNSNGTPTSLKVPNIGESFDRTVHVVDLLTAGSSCYRVDGVDEKGWIPMIRNSGGKVSDLIAVVTRLQGGEENLASHGIKTHSFVKIDEDFLNAHSLNAERAVAYIRNPRAWSQEYLTEHGALDLVGIFDPAGNKMQRAIKFVKLYGETLIDAGEWDELRGAVRNKHEYSIDQWVNEE